MKINNNDLPKITITIPTYNASSHLESCLISIRNQDYPPNKIEIIVSDGGSEDDTIQIAKAYGAIIVTNKKKLAEYGVAVAIQHANGDLLVSMAADNELKTANWLNAIIQPFLYDESICVSWCKLSSGINDSNLNKYYALIQNDPFTFFMNNNLDYYIRSGQKIFNNYSNYYVFQVDITKPLPWGANAITYRTKLIKRIWKDDKYLGDNDAFQEMIESGMNKIAFFPDLYVIHHTVKNIPHWISKFKRNFHDHFLSKRTTRNLNWIFVNNFKIKVILWLIYSLIPLFSITDAVIKMIKDKSIYWAYHPIMCFLQSVIYIYILTTTVNGRNYLKELILNH